MPYVVSIVVNAFLATALAAVARAYGLRDLSWILLSLALIWCNVYQLQRSERHAKQRFTRIQRVS